MPFCEGCGKQLADTDRFCQQCGRDVPLATRIPPALASAAARHRALPAKKIGLVVGLAIVAVVAIAIIRGMGGRPPLVYCTADGVYYWTPGMKEAKRVSDAEGVLDAVPSPNGKLVAYIKARQESSREFSTSDFRLLRIGHLVICDLRGKVIKESSGDEYSNPKWTPGGNGVSVTKVDSRDGGPDGIYLFDLKKDGEPKEIVASRYEPLAYWWSPDGRHIAFVSTEEGKYRLLVADAEGKDTPSKVTSELQSERGPMADWLSDKELVYLQDDVLRVYSVDSKDSKRLVGEEASKLLTETRSAMRRKDRMVALVEGEAGMPAELALLMDLGASSESSGYDVALGREAGSKYYRLGAKSNVSYAVIAEGDEVGLEIVTQEGKTIATGKREEGKPARPGDTTVAVMQSKEKQTVYAKVSLPKGKEEAECRVWAVCDRSEGATDSVEGPGGSGLTLTKDGRYPGDNVLTFVGRGGESVEITTSSADMDTMVELRKGEGTEGEVIATQYGWTFEGESTLSASLPATGMYTVVVTTSPWSGVSGGGFHLTAQGPGLTREPTSPEDAWPLKVAVGGLWAGAARLDDVEKKSFSINLVSPTVGGFSRAVWRPRANEYALIYTTVEREKRSTSTGGMTSTGSEGERGHRKSECYLLLVGTNGKTRTIPLTKLEDEDPLGLEWSGDGSHLAILTMRVKESVTRPWEDTGLSSKSTTSLWVAPAGHPEQLRRLSDEVEGVAWHSDGSGGQGLVQ